MRYEILEHRADLKIRVFGKTKEELILNAMLGMEAGLPDDTPPEGVRRLPSGGKRSRKIKINSTDSNALLVDFLSEVLYLIQTNKEVYDDIKFKKLSDTELEAELFGQKAERFGEDIKAVTYHGLDIRQEAGLWQVMILFDI